MKATLRTDGGARPRNPGHAAFAAIVKLEDGMKLKCSRYIGNNKSNNYAEYAGVLVGVKMALDHGVTDLTVISDSKLVVEQLNENWRCKDHELKVMKKEIKDMLEKFHRAEVVWKDRSSNQEADEMCTAAIAYGRNKNRFTPARIKEKRGAAYVEDPFDPSMRA